MHGDFETAHAMFLEAIDLARTITGLDRESHYLAHLSEARLGAGDIAGARATAEEAAVRAEQRETRFDEIHSWLVLSRALALYREMGATDHAKRLQREVG